VNWPRTSCGLAAQVELTGRRAEAEAEGELERGAKSGRLAAREQPECWLLSWAGSLFVVDWVRASVASQFGLAADQRRGVSAGEQSGAGAHFLALLGPFSRNIVALEHWRASLFGSFRLRSATTPLELSDAAGHKQADQFPPQDNSVSPASLPSSLPASSMASSPSPSNWPPTSMIEWRRRPKACDVFQSRSARRQHSTAHLSVRAELAGG